MACAELILFLNYYKKYFQEVFCDIMNKENKIRIFTYGISKDLKKKIRKKYGMDATIVDVTEQYQDILACCADIVVVNKEKIPYEEWEYIQSYQRAINDYETEYLVGNRKELEEILCTERVIRKC